MEFYQTCYGCESKGKLNEFGIARRKGVGKLTNIFSLRIGISFVLENKQGQLKVYLIS